MEGIRIYQMVFKLLKPYELSFRTLSSYSTFIVEMINNGMAGLGEVTYLPGYGSETIDGGFEAARKLCSNLIEIPPDDAIEVVRDANCPEFTRSALVTAAGAVNREVPDLSVPLVATLSNNSPLQDAQNAVEEGYSKFKLKVGFDPYSDAELAASIIDEVGKGALRVDANKGFTLKDAKEFLSPFGPDDLRLLEQPLEVGDFEGHRELRGRGTPIMLDEDVWSIEDIEKIAEEDAADMVKLKLFKSGSPGDLLAMAERASELGLGTVVGNGVQTGLGCLHEAEVWSEIENSGLAGEMNGFLKMKDSLLIDPPEEIGGKLVWEGGFPALAEGLAPHVVRRASF